MNTLKIATLALWILGGCSGSSFRSTTVPNGAQPFQSPTPVVSEAAGSGDYRAGTSSPQAPSAIEKSTVDESRPGLGTGWGEQLHSPTRSVVFERQSTSPQGTASIWYNDRAGVAAAGVGSGWPSQAEVSMFGGRILVSFRKPNYQPYPVYETQKGAYLVGEVGERYTIIIQNRTSSRLECVASVDGLDAIDGQAAAFGKRGYLIGPHATLELEGFRTAEDSVAAFRFSSVDRSYSVQSGKGDRNIGVIGLAFFAERFDGAWPSSAEVHRREQADPFPARYAQPPQ